MNFQLDCLKTLQEIWVESSSFRIGIPSRKLGAIYRTFYISLKIVTKNLKKILVIYHHRIYFHEFFQMSKSNSALKGRKLLNIDFFPCYLNGKLRVRAPIQTDQTGPSHHMEYFLLFFWKLFT